MALRVVAIFAFLTTLFFSISIIPGIAGGPPIEVAPVCAPMPQPCAPPACGPIGPQNPLRDLWRLAWRMHQYLRDCNRHTVGHNGWDPSSSPKTSLVQAQFLCPSMPSSMCSAHLRAAYMWINGALRAAHVRSSGVCSYWDYQM